MDLEELNLPMLYTPTAAKPLIVILLIKKTVLLGVGVLHWIGWDLIYIIGRQERARINNCLSKVIFSSSRKTQGSHLFILFIDELQAPLCFQIF